MAADRLACHHTNTLTRVLIVDDHPSFRATARALLQAEGFEVATRLTSQNGAQPAVVLTSSRDGSDFGPLVAQSGARGFIAKGELSGSALKAVLG